MGCTTEFNKWEGITYDAASKKIYTALSSAEKGMEDGHASSDLGTGNHLRMQANKCGCVMELDVDFNFRASKARMLTCGIYTGGSPDSCATGHIASPDNVAMIPRFNQLLIGEDTGRHQNDLVWAYDLRTGQMTRIASTPYGSETTSPYWFTIGDFDYMSYVIQHPYGESDQAQLSQPGSTGELLSCLFAPHMCERLS